MRSRGRVQRSTEPPLPTKQEALGGLSIRDGVLFGGLGDDRLLKGADEPNIQRVEDSAGALDGDPMVLIALVAGYLRLVNTEALGELALGEAERDSKADEHMPEPVEVHEL